MNCIECQEIAKARCECNLMFCGNHGFSHSIDMHHILHKYIEEVERKHNNLYETNKRVTSISRIQREICSEASDLIKLIGILCQKYIERLEIIKKSYLSGDIENREFFLDDYASEVPNTTNITELIKSLYSVEKLDSNRLMRAKQKLADRGLFIQGHTGIVLSIAVTIDNNFIISGGADTTVRIWNLKKKCQEAVLDGHTHSVTAVAVTSDNNFIVSGSNDKTIKIWKIQTRRQEASLEGHTSAIKSIVVTSDNNFIVSVCSERTIIWEFNTKLQVAVIETNCIDTIALTSNNEFMISGDINKVVRIWSLKIRRQVAALEGHTGFVNAVAVSSDNKYIVSGSSDCTVRIWNFKTRSQEAVLEGHSSYVNTVVVTSDNNYIISGGNDSDISIWNLKNRCLEAMLLRYSHVKSVAVTSDNNLIVIGGQESLIEIWNLKTKCQ